MNLADSSLEMARHLRRAVEDRAEALTEPVVAYDVATSEAERWEAAAELMGAIERSDRVYEQAKREITRRYGEREDRAA